MDWSEKKEEEKHRLLHGAQSYARAQKLRVSKSSTGVGNMNFKKIPTYTYLELWTKYLLTEITYVHASSIFNFKKYEKRDNFYKIILIISG